MKIQASLNIITDTIPMNYIQRWQPKAGSKKETDEQQSASLLYHQK